MTMFKFFVRPPRPNNLALYGVYWGGILICLGKAILAPDPQSGFGMLFSNVGEWTIFYALLCYLIGFWRYRGW